MEQHFLQQHQQYQKHQQIVNAQTSSLQTQNTYPSKQPMTTTATINSHSSSSSSSTLPPPPGSRLRLDDKGNLVDAEGNVIHLQNKPIATSLANVRRKKEENKNKLKFEKPPNVKHSEFYDPSAPLPKFSKKRKDLKFYGSGDILREVKRQRTLEMHQKKIEEKKQMPLPPPPTSNGSTGTSSALPPPKQEFGETQLILGSTDAVPDVEWWDQVILSGGQAKDQRESYQQPFKEKLVCNTYVEHPVPIDAAYMEIDPGPLPLILTARERKKARTQIRVQREKLKQREIQLGLRPPPKPKANLKNFMRVHLNDGTTDPTKLEKEIREQIQQRIQNHEKRNQERKLTKEQRKEKIKKKLEEDAAKELVVSVFRVSNATHPQARFRIQANALQYQITGCVILCGDIHIIVSEGGPKAIRKFSHILINRVPWTDSLNISNQSTGANGNHPLGGESKEESGEDEAVTGTSQHCIMVWKGVQQKRNFLNFRYQEFQDEATARKFLHAHGVGHLWDQAMFNLKDEASSMNANSS